MHSFCLPCVLFATSNDLGQFLTEKFNFWHKKSKSHNSKKYHQFTLSQVDALKSTQSMPETSIQSRLKHVYSSDVARNRQIIKSMADAILLCGRQCLPLRGHRDDSSDDEQGNRGTFLALLEFSVTSFKTEI